MNPGPFRNAPLFGEIQKGTAGRGRETKNVTTIYDKRHDNLRYFMTISVSLFH